MKHIQKHRRGRALNRLATRLDEDNAGVLNVKCCHVIVYPLACSYLFNNEYTKYSDTIQVIGFMLRTIKMYKKKNFDVA